MFLKNKYFYQDTRP